MTTSDTIGRVPRPRGEVPQWRIELLERARKDADRAQLTYRIEVVLALTNGGSFNEVARITGLSKDTLQRWKREAGK
jgi:DNA invertase Pin-like site-specific DNA recombinase